MNALRRSGAIPTGASPIETGALLAIIDQAGHAVLTLVENLSRDELLRSRLTRIEVQRQLRTIALSAAALRPETRALMPEVDWSALVALGERMALPHGTAPDEALWFACQSQVPALLLWLRVYRHAQPRLFSMQP